MTPVLNKPGYEKKTEASVHFSVSEPASPLPGFNLLFSAAALITAPLVAVALIAGKPWTAGSLVAGMTISLIVCGLLHLFVTRIMPLLVVGLQGPGSVIARNGVVTQFVALVAVKFLVLGLIGYAIINFPEVYVPAVLVGFALAQAAIVVTVSRYLKSG